MKQLIWGKSKAEYFCRDDWTGFRTRWFFCPSGKSLDVARYSSFPVIAGRFGQRTSPESRTLLPVIPGRRASVEPGISRHDFWIPGSR
jgi:hypothetical protein